MCAFQAVFCDIDGTLLNSSHQITPDTKEKIRTLHGNRIPFVLVSARMPAAIYPIQEELGIHAPIISYGGALILDKDRNALSSTGLSLSLAAEIEKHVPLDTDSYCFCAYSYDKWITRDSLHPIIRREEEVTQVASMTGTMETLLNPEDPVHKLMCFGPSGLLDQIAGHLKAEFPQCTIYKSFHTLLEIMDGRASKSRAVHALCKKLGISPQNAAAFGDNYNDVDMLQSVGCGIAMGNAPEEVKRMASGVTGDHDHEGLLQAINHMFP